MKTLAGKKYLVVRRTMLYLYIYILGGAPNKRSLLLISSLFTFDYFLSIYNFQTIQFT